MPQGPYVPYLETIRLANYKNLSGTYTPTMTTGKYTLVRSTAAATNTVLVPFGVQQPGPQFGKMLNSINIPVLIGSAAVTTITAHLYQQNIYLSGTSTVTAVSIPITVTATKTTSTTERLWTFAVTSPAFDTTSFTINPVSYVLQLSITFATATTFSMEDGYLSYNVVTTA